MAKKISAEQLAWLPGGTLADEETRRPFESGAQRDARVAHLRSMVKSHQESAARAFASGDASAARPIMLDLVHCLDLLVYAENGINWDHNAARRNSERDIIRRATGNR